jgi:hypothetical protein
MVPDCVSHPGECASFQISTRLGTGPLDSPPTWRTAADTGMYKDIYFTNVSSDVTKAISLHGKSATVNIDGVHFTNLTIQGKTIASKTDSNASWDINSYATGITFP